MLSLGGEVSPTDEETLRGVYPERSRRAQSDIAINYEPPRPTQIPTF